MPKSSTTWKPGQSGNPDGRGKDKLFRQALVMELKEAGEDLPELRDIARALAARPADLARGASDEAAARSLFDQADATLGDRDGSNLAVTVYDLAGSPIAWSGRPSELPRDRVTGRLSDNTLASAG